jgi:hypothetical protein
MESRYEFLFGLTLALFAALLAINDLGAGKYGDDELQLSNEKTSAYLWYQAKGIKESLTEGQRDLLEVLLDSEAIRAEQRDALTRLVEDLGTQVGRYKKEKKEILMGSAYVGQANWVQDVAGQLGKVVGAKEIEDRLAVLGAAGERFDLANLFLQLSLVLGAIGILMRHQRAKIAFFALMTTSGVTGVVWSALGFARATMI